MQANRVKKGVGVRRVVVDVIPGHSRFYHFNLGESSEALPLRCLCPWLAKGTTGTEITDSV